MSACVGGKVHCLLLSFLSPFRRGARCPFYGWARASLVVALLAISCEPSRTEEANSPLLKLRFGETTIAFASGAIAWISGHGKPERWSDSTMNLDRNASVFFTPPFTIPACLEIGQVILIYRTVEPVVRQPLFANYAPMATEFRDISQLKPPSGRPAMDLYQFDSRDLRDFWGEQITFHREPPMTHLNIQLTRDTQMRVAATAGRCFFERGEATIRQLMLFVSSKIRK